MNDKPNLVRASEAVTLDGLFRARVARSPDAPACRQFDTERQDWTDTSWRELAALVGRWQAALRGEGLAPGDRVALLLRNCREWVAFEQAALGLGLVVVPLYVEDRPDNAAYVLADAGVKVLLLQDAHHHWKRLAPLAGQLADLKRVIILGEPDEALLADDPRLCAAHAWLAAEPEPLTERNGDPHDLATIVYTSGTTGRPKGVMLSHHNILSNAEAALSVLEVKPDDLMLSFLPLSHTFERTCGYYAPMMAGCCIAYARSVQHLADDLTRVRPTILISVPRVYERVHERVQNQLAQGNAAARLLFRLTVAAGWQRFLHSQGQRRWRPVQLLWPTLDRLVGTRFRARLGGRLRHSISGGAALPPSVARTFIGLGVNVLQGYGMTEASPVVSANTPGHARPASVGRALPGVETQVGPNDELLVRGPNVMQGYWNNHRATREMIDPQGWLHTGDQVRIDEEGNIYITGRIKDILVMSNGEKVPPGDMEMAITLDPWFDQALVVGEGRPYLGALVVLNPEHWFAIAREHDLDPFRPDSLADRRLQHTLVQRIGRALHDFPGYVKVRRVAPLLEAWTVDNGLMTPTLKVKRALVMQRYAAQLDALYA